jgi:hypothetical protein
MLSGSLGLILAGCGAIPEAHPIPPDERGLKELGQVYRSFAAKNKRGPKNLKELNIKGQQCPIAVEMINSGKLVVQWGAPLSPEGESSSAILAYIESAPKEGGNVLLQDGTTIKKMTPDEFKSAAKASSQ